MKRGCLILILVFPVVSLAAASVALYVANQEYGIFQAPPVSHELLTRENTRLRVAVKLDELAGFLLEAMPEETALPSWGPFRLEDYLQELVPREVALLGGANYRDGSYEFTVFINERRGGPVLASLLNESGVFSQLAVIHWDERGMAFQQRGMVTLEGALPVPDEAEELVLTHWTHDAPDTPLSLEGGHLLEAALDNRNGDVVTLWAALLHAEGHDLPALLREDVQMKLIFDTLTQLTTGHMQADLVAEDELLMDVRIGAVPQAGPNLQMMLGAFVLPEIRQHLETEYGLTLDGELRWQAAEQQLAGQFRLRGFHDRVVDALRGVNAGSRQSAPAVR